MGISQGPNSNLDSHLKIAIFHLCKAKKKYALATDDQKIIKRHILAKNLSSLTLDLRKHTIILVYFLPATTTIEGSSIKDVKKFWGLGLVGVFQISLLVDVRAVYCPCPHIGVNEKLGNL